MLADSKIRTFLAVVEEGSFSRAAKKLGVTQPAVSAAVASLEAQLGVVLIERGAVLHLTASGELFLGYARRIQDAYNLVNRAFSK